MSLVDLRLRKSTTSFVSCCCINAHTATLDSHGSIQAMYTQWEVTIVYGEGGGWVPHLPNIYMMKKHCRCLASDAIVVLLELHTSVTLCEKNRKFIKC